MLDQKLIRENPTFVEESLSSRGKAFNISEINKLTPVLRGLCNQRNITILMTHNWPGTVETVFWVIKVKSLGMVFWSPRM